MYKNTIESLNPRHSTTRLVHRLLGSDFFNENYRIKEGKKFNVNIPRLGIYGSVIRDKPGSKIETRLFMPVGEGRQGEGGLRTKGYFKHSYEIRNGRWYATDAYGRRLMKVKPPRDFQIEAEQTYLPLVTVITVVLNGEKYLEETILSVINQTYPNVEYIIIDGGSTDGTLDIIRKYEDKIDYWISEKDKGIYNAMNKGIYLTNYDSYMLFLNAGDSLVSNEVLTKIFSNIRRDVKVIYGGVIVCDENGNMLSSLQPFELTKRNLNIFGTRVVCHQSIFVHRDISPAYNAKYKLKGELNWYYDITENLTFSKEIKRINGPISYYLLGGKGDKGFYRNNLERLKLLYERNDSDIIAFYLSLPSFVIPLVFRLRRRIFGK